MVSEFKFFGDNITFLDDDSPSWMYETNYPVIFDLPYDVIVSEHRGIREFLSMFPIRSIVVVRKLSAWCEADGEIREHDGIVQYPDGWGFDITRDVLTVEWLKFNE
jgi:hypothetical protein